MASLIKTTGGKVPSRAIQFADRDGKRRTIRLGKCGLEAARRFKTRVERLLSCVITNTPFDVETSTWLAGLSDKMHARLVRVDLVSPREPEPTAPTLKDWLTKYIGQRASELKPASVKAIKRTVKLLRGFLGNDIRINEITPNHAKDWRALLAKDLSEASVRHHCRNAKKALNDVLERELIGKNPFKCLVSTAVSADRDHYVRPQQAQSILEACPDIRWRTLFAFCRFAGLRCPSETHLLTWADVD